MVDRFPSLRLIIAILPIALIGACTPTVPSDTDQYIRNIVAKTPVYCRDGVEYFVNDVQGGYVLTPHLQRNGIPYPCGEEPVEPQSAGS